MATSDDNKNAKNGEIRLLTKRYIFIRVNAAKVILINLAAAISG